MSKTQMVCPKCGKALSALSQNELWKRAQGEILEAWKKFYPETSGIELWHCDKHGDVVVPT